MVINVPETGKYEIENIVFDYNGTIAINGEIINGILEKIVKLAESFNVTIITADTFNTVKRAFKNTDVNIHIIDSIDGTIQKKEFVEEVGSNKTIALGNGRNDELMLKEAIISVAILNDEGVSLKALNNADFLLKDINHFFEMIEEPKKLVAILRK
ncbi:ATPase P [Clostridiaceae bacterium HSG29]|nr:ATPase P [Clostridiaceae bacterium HSG29]